MTEPDDWRLLNDVEYLRGIWMEPTDAADLRKYKPELKHCIFCWKQVPEPKPFWQQWYVPQDKSCAVCEDCYNDFCAAFGWKTTDGWDTWDAWEYGNKGVNHNE